MKQIVPSKTDLERFIRAGKTDTQIAHEVHCSRSAISMARKRYGLIAAQPRKRYTEELPWTVKVEHRMDNDARMLRLRGRRSGSHVGLPLTAKETRILGAWEAQMDRLALVIDYDSNTGFSRVPWQPGDEGYIREPKQEA